MLGNLGKVISFFLSLVCGFLSYSWSQPMVEAEDLKIYDMRCHLGFMLVSWKYFFPEVLIDYSIYFLLKMCLEKNFQRFFGGFLACHLNATKHFWMRQYLVLILHFTYTNILLYTKCSIWTELHKFFKTLLSSSFSPNNLISDSDKVHIFRQIFKDM